MTVLYTEDGLWLETIDFETVRIGLSAYGADAVGDISYFNLAVKETVQTGETLFAVEGSKAVTEILAPISGEVISYHTALDETPELLNAQNHDKNWILLIKANEKLDTNAFRKTDRPIDQI